METKQPWFLAYARNVTSQFGEDGILERILQIIGKTDGWCVEFGAADGKYCSNTNHLITSAGYSAVLIEADPEKYKLLQHTFGNNSKVTLLNTFVGFEKDDNLDTLLQNTAIPKDPDVVSIDIDGNDYYVWEATSVYRPKVVIIEYNPTIPSQVEFVQEKDMHLSQGCSLMSLVKLGKAKGYELVAVTHSNGIFIEASYYPFFRIEDNSLFALRVDEKAVTYLFSGFDGKIFLRGCNRLPWHGLSLKEYRIQALPWFLRCYPTNYNFFQKILAKIHRSLRKKRLI
jgi:hypothetical protein